MINNDSKAGNNLGVDQFRELDSDELKVYRKALRISDTNFWKLYTLDYPISPVSNSSNIRSQRALMKVTNKSKIIVSEAESVYEVVVYSGKDFDTLRSNLYPPLNEGEIAEIEVNPEEDQVYILIWTLGQLKAETSNNSIDGATEPTEIDTEPLIDYSMDHIDATMRLLYASRLKEDVAQDDTDIIGPYKIGQNFGFELNPSESAVCIGYGLKPVVNWNTSNDPYMKTLDIKLINRPGSKIEFGPLACRLYEVVMD